MKTKILVIHHNDRDGIVAAALVYQYLNCKSTKIEFVSCGYQGPLLELVPDKDYDCYYLVDYSISTIENAEYIAGLANSGKEVIWIDHHQSSLKFVSKEANWKYKLNEISGYRVIGLSGAALTWLWFNYNNFCFNPNYITGINNYRDSMDEMPYDEATHILTDLKCPYYVLYTHWYDIHDIREEVLDFSYGYNPTDPKEVAFEFSGCTGYECDKCFDTGCHLNKYIERGRICKEYQNSKDENIALQIGFEVTIKVSVNGTHGYTLTGFAMDRVFGNSQAFGDRMDKYDICIPFYFNGTGFTYSMYTKKDDINCATLCEAMGGGGHPKAAGFISNDFLFLKEDILRIYLDDEA